MKPFLLALFLGLAPAPAAACSLALVLAIDISNSVDGAEYRLQTEGLADALLDSVVRHELVRGRMAVTVMFWSGPAGQYVVIPWTRIETDDDVVAVSDAARNLRRVYAQSNTALGAAVDYARGLFDEVPDCKRRTIDVSGDGVENAGTNPARARDAAFAERITVNGLAIERDVSPVTRYFRNNVITPNGFVMTSQGHRGYANTLRRKLRREVGEGMS